MRENLPALKYLRLEYATFKVTTYGQIDQGKKARNCIDLLQTMFGKAL